MKNGICPKCDGREIYRQTGNPHALETIALSDGVVNRGAAPVKYICAACGFLEYYLQEPQHIQTIRENWERVRPQ